MSEAVGADITGHNRGVLATRPNFSKNLEPYFPGWLIIVNETGQRFFDELSPYSVTKTIVRLQDSRVFAVWDDEAKRASQPGSSLQAKKVNLPGFTSEDWVEPALNEMERLGKIARGETLAELAKAIDVPADNLQRTVERYNNDTRGGCDTLFLKNPSLMREIRVPPFYATELRQRQISLTATGPRIDREARVLNAGSTAIPGLYAAGECVGGILGEVYIGTGNSVSNCIVFGRIAGRNAAREASQAT